MERSVYTDHYKLADDLIAHLTVTIPPTDFAGRARFTGYVSVSAITVFELSVKEIICDFAQRKHVTLGHFVASHFDRINGRVRLRNIQDDYLKPLGGPYLRRFKRHLGFAESALRRASRADLRSAYENLVTWRNDFAHEGRLPATATFGEVTQSYEYGKRVLACLHASLARD